MIKQTVNPLILSKNEFSMMVEEKAAMNRISCLEIILDMVEKDSVAIESIPELLNEKLLKKIEVEASSLNLLKKKKSLFKNLKV